MSAEARIPLVDLGAQFGSIKGEVMRAIEDVLESMHLFLGPNMQAFEDEFARYCGTRFAVGLGSGTDALHLALRAAGVGPGDEVITVSHTFFATAEAIIMAGAQPVFVDVDPRTLTMDPAHLESRITPRTRAIIPVHLYGRMCDMDPIMQVAERRGLLVIEDAAQAHGARYRGRRAGSIGHIGCFSFYYSKNLGAYGEAGAITTSDPALAQRVRLFRDHGSEVRYQHQAAGFNARLDEIQAAILRIKLRYLDDWNTLRQQHAGDYNELLTDSGVEVPEVPTDGSHVFHLYVIRSPERDEVQRKLEAAGIGTGIHYPVPIHLQPAMADLGYKAGDLPVTEQAATEILSLPMYAELQQAQLDRVVASVRAASGHGDRRGSVIPAVQRAPT